jgi:chromosome segregation ATPase
MAEAESGILEAEKEYRTVLRQLDDMESVNSDQLSRLEREIDAANTAIVELRREGTRAKKSKYKAGREASSVAFQLGALFSAEKGRDHRERVKKLDATIRSTEDQTAKKQEELKSLQQQHDVLAHPLRELQQQLEELNKKRNDAKQALGKTGSAINTWMSDRLQRLSSDELRLRLNNVADMSPDSDLFRVCADELIRATTELQAHLSDRARNETQMQQATAAAEQTTNALGENIVLGFQQTTTEQRTNVRLSGSISFREEHGMFSGYSGASGSASGSGTGHASYTVDQLQWSAASDFGQRVTAFTDAWSRCGDLSASIEMLDSLVAACEQRVEDLVRLVRAELERDFGGGPTR